MGVAQSRQGLASGGGFDLFVICVQRACYDVLTAMRMLDYSYFRDSLAGERMRPGEQQARGDRRVEGSERDIGSGIVWFADA